MSRVKKVEPVVLEVLKENVDARGDDFILVYEVYKKINPNVELYSFQRVMLEHKSLGLPYFESVRRTRPKLQNKYPELLPPQPVVEARKSEEADYRDYALNDK